MAIVGIANSGVESMRLNREASGPIAWLGRTVEWIKKGAAWLAGMGSVLALGVVSAVRTLVGGIFAVLKRAVGLIRPLVEMSRVGTALAFGGIGAVILYSGEKQGSWAVKTVARVVFGGLAALALGIAFAPESLGL